MVHAMRGNTHRLDHDDHLVTGSLWNEHRKWPGFRTLWLWARQGCPRNFPVITEEGIIAARATGREADGTPQIDAADITISDWEFDMSLLPAGSITASDVIDGLLERRAASVIFPDDGHTEHLLLRYRDS